jgi:hypothetical protein
VCYVPRREALAPSVPCSQLWCVLRVGSDKHPRIVGACMEDLLKDLIIDTDDVEENILERLLQALLPSEQVK